ncbi:MAG: hypothetical protein P8Y79_14075 [Ignavibacteriaceae bacterium]
MTDLTFPICPICKREVLLPFSTMQVGEHNTYAKQYGTWACSNCGFFLSTIDKSAVNPDIDIEAGFSIKLRKKVEELRKQHMNEQL